MESIVGSLVVLFVLWMALAIGCGFGSKSIFLGKGRSGTAGFWLGFCLGLTGLLIAALLSATPEHEARKMQQQMQLMGIAPPPPGASAPAPTPTSLPFAAAPKAKSLTTEPSVVIALVVSAAYALAWMVGGNEFKFAFGDTKFLTLLVFAAGIGLAVAALRKKAPLYVGWASGVALGLCGVGIVGVAHLLGGDGSSRNVSLAFLPVDIAAFVGAVLIVARSNDQVPPEAATIWWKQASLGLAGAGVLLTFIASTDELATLFLANASIWGGFGVAGLCLLKGGRIPLALAAGWSVTTVVHLLGTDFNGLGPSSAMAVLVTMAAAGTAGLSLWAQKQLELASPSAAVTTDVAPTPTHAQHAPTIFAPAPPPPPVAPQPAPVPSFPAPTPMMAVPSLVSPLAAQVPDATVPRLRIVRQVRFATGELVALNGALVLGRAPVAPERAPTAQTLVVPDSSFMISSTHCWLSLEDGEVWVEDLGSTNGTDVVSPSGTTELGGGQRMVLTSADRVQLGDNWCQLEPSPQVLT